MAKKKRFSKPEPAPEKQPGELQLAVAKHQHTTTAGDAPMIYYYDQSTGAFLKTGFAELDQLATKAVRSAQWLIPANATLTAPPADGADYVWKNGEWEKVSD